MAGRGLSGRLTQYGDPEFAAYLRRSFARSFGLSSEALGRPVVGIVNTFSELNNCHRGLPEASPPRQTSDRPPGNPVYWIKFHRDGWWLAEQSMLLPGTP